ncbi:unnamed protein product (macronuclear) [Paramecium tetraurelia]|uniref:Uncharacterized protein n=1 Tax=Paramecium tetraurelia TaxID=5888 RepID=A0CE39_PARTE|nr:uncharacterized protein GSPATT00007268001 [Paramecium tetraurelia]CAK69056.1 unnamed protein product [Paramecium tetraurelia]|eukprot:XP_001436453.1 hypothetical protein (macronuclear) [Paramecium tetraurelia strain d4-2]
MNSNFLPRFRYMDQLQRFIQITRNTSKSELISFNTQYKSLYKIKPITYQLPGFYNYIKQEIIQGDIESLNKASTHYFSKEGKLIRPMLNLLYANHIEKNSQHTEQQRIWAAVIEILHVASLVHDDILDASDTRRGIPSSHTIFGKHRATFSANYLIGRAGRKISELDDIRMFQIYSQIMDNLTNGEYLQAMKQKSFHNFEITLQNYMIKTYYKTAALIANSLQGVCQLTNIKDEICEKSFNIGLHLGVAFQIIDDVLDYTSNSEQLGKASLNDLKSGVLTGPVLFELFNQQKKQSPEYKLMNSVLLGESNQYDTVNQIVLAGEGIEQSKYLAYQHTQEALKILQSINSQPDQDLISLIFMFIDRNK